MSWLRRTRTIAIGGALAMTVLALFWMSTVLLWQRWQAEHGAGWTHDPEDAAWVLSPTAEQLIDRSLADAKGRAVIDHGVDLISRGQLSGPDFSNDSRDGSRHQNGLGDWLGRRLRHAAAGITADQSVDADYVSRLLRQIRAVPIGYRAHITARDGVFDAKGAPVGESAAPTVSNRYVLWLSQRANDAFMPVVSVHPQRPDASQALTRWAEAGARKVRWWPAAQRIDLTSDAAKAAYKTMAAHDMRLIVNVGQLTDDEGQNRWIAPSAIEPALAAGVPVRLRLGRAHGDDDRKLMPALFALLRQHEAAMKADDKDDPSGRISISLGGVLYDEQPEAILEPLLQHPQFFDRLVYASDYPAIARADALDLHTLADHGFIARADLEPLRAIYDVNPLLFTYVVMRSIHLPATSLKLPAEVFYGEPKTDSAN